MERPGVGTQLFRGHGNPDWLLLPGMARPRWINDDDQRLEEGNAYFGFVTSAGPLLPVDADSWTVAFAMQHHGLPTRLLDWSHNFAVAVHFALRDSSPDLDSVIWVLDPYELNLQSMGTDSLLHPNQLSSDYKKLFIDRTAKPDGDVVAIVPIRHHPRVFSQQSGFTLHADLKTPLNVLHPECVTKIHLPKAAKPDAEAFLRLAGITEFTLFPDLDALGRLMRPKFAR